MVAGPSAAQVAAAYLRQTGNPGVGWGDSRLLHEIAQQLGMPAEGPVTERKVLARIERSYFGILDKRYMSMAPAGPGRVRQFWLPECVQDRCEAYR